ncbi:hypothetical protein ACH4U6_15395 [Streptomyces netropsis]|uniref:hypothetical protein n=1 Tax=Streptomyces netropsis TaxID=55404 RepID=UPI0037BCCAC8
MTVPARADPRRVREIPSSVRGGIRAGVRRRRYRGPVEPSSGVGGSEPTPKAGTAASPPGWRAGVERTLLSLARRGNTAGVVVFGVLEQTFTEPPRPGALGLVIAFGPGVTTVAVTGTWIAEP